MSDLRATLLAFGSLIRRLPLFFRDAPQTPLRVLGIIALDILHVLRHSRPLPRETVTTLALFVDFEGCANKVWDHKSLCHADYESSRQRLAATGREAFIEEYLRRLAELESRRPRIGGDLRRFDEVRSYREAVAELSVAAVTALAFNAESLEQQIDAMRSDSDLGTLVRILMQCQIIDDVVDYADDLSARLPSFLTASVPLSLAIALTARAARSYGVNHEHSSAAVVFPVRVALWVFTVAATLVIHVGHRRFRHHRQIKSGDTWPRIGSRPSSY